MGLIKTIHNPLITEESTPSADSDTVFQTLLDDIVNEYASLIADVEDQRVDASYLMREIEKKVMRQKNIYDPEQLKERVLNAIYGYSILEPYIKDTGLSDIDGTRFDYFVGKRAGKIERLPIAFESEKAFEQFCKVIVIRQGGLINQRDAHCRVSDRKHRLRINVCIAPRNTTGTSISIRRHTERAYSFDALKALHFLDDAAHEILEAAQFSRRSILICGKGGSGKTTLLRTLIDTNNCYERMLICEADSEIYPQNKNAIVQQSQKKNGDAQENTLEAIVREGLTMSLDTYCVGELTGAESWPFIKAGHTGHRILGTLHANSGKDALTRLLMLIENETAIEAKLLTELIASCIDLVVYVKDFKLVEITEILSFDHTKRLYTVPEMGGFDAPYCV